MNIRSGLIPTLLVLLSLVAFSAGYFTYPYINPSPIVSEPNLGVFWEAWDLLNSNFFGTKPDDKARAYGATKGMVEAFNDPYTMFVEPSPQELQDDNLRGKFGGIGAQILQTDAGFVLRPLPDQPAAKAGILDGDLLLKVDDAEITAEMSSDDVVAHIRGEVGTEVSLLVRRTISATNSLDELTFKVVRAELELPSVMAQLIVTTTTGTSDEFKIGYMHQSIFSERSPDEMTKALSDLRQQGATHFIWDLRGNPGGRVDSATKLADIWLDGGVIVSEAHVDGSKESIDATAGGDGVDLPLILIVDGGSASASEIVSGAFQDSGRAKLVGQQTFGKGSVQLLYTLSDGSSLHVTNAQWLTPNGNQISGKGLTPDILVAPEVDPLPIAIEELLKDK